MAAAEDALLAQIDQGELAGRLVGETSTQRGGREGLQHDPDPRGRAVYAGAVRSGILGPRRPPLNRRNAGRRRSARSSGTETKNAEHPTDRKSGEMGKRV